MIRITAARFQKSYGHYTHLARDGHVVMVTSHGSDRAAIISAELMEELARASGRLDLLEETEVSDPVSRKSRPTKAAGKKPTPAKAEKAPAVVYSGVRPPSMRETGLIAMEEIAASDVDEDEDPPEFQSRRG